MDIQILAVEGDDIKFKRVDGTDKTEKSMKKSITTNLKKKNKLENI